MKLASADFFDNIVILGDLFPPCLKLTEVYGVFEREELISFFTVFKGFQLPSVVLLKSSEVLNTFILSNLSKILPNQFVVVSSSLDKSVLNNYFRIDDISSELCMVTDRGSENFLKSNSSFTHVSSKDLDRIDYFYRSHHTFPWNPIQLESQFYFFQEIENIIVACGGTHFETPELAHLGNILVLPKYRGQSVGKNLVSTIGNEILKKKRFITLFVVNNNVPAIQLYKKLGFSHKKNYSIFTCNSV
jgi:GNAT superfamily N-acetyltransferase